MWSKSSRPKMLLWDSVNWNLCHSVIWSNWRNLEVWKACGHAWLLMLSTSKREGCDTFAKWRNLKSECLSSTSVRKECLARKFLKTSCKPLGGFPFTHSEQWRNGQHSLRGIESIEDDGRSGRSKDGIADDNFKVVHTLVLCDMRQDLQSTAS